VPEAGLRITYVGHATILLELDGVRILTDPVLRPRVVHLHRLVALDDSVKAAIRGPHAILVSHLHFDHFDPGSLQMFDRGTTILVPRGGAVQVLRRRGFTDVRGIDEGMSVQIGEVTVQAVHAQHPGSRGIPWVKGPALGYLIEASSSVYFAGDTDIFPEMSELSGADLALLPVAGWGPRLPEGEHMSPKRAAEALKVLRPRVAIPIHWGTLAPLWAPNGYPALGFPAADFRRYAGEIAPEVEVPVLEPGQAFTMPTSLKDSAIRTNRGS
jgi:L-ascorbate metabolism protein UlaG (beta-lactamase superfamily)